MRERIDPNPKHRPGAYVSFLGELYEVLAYERTGPSSGMLHVENARKPGCLVRLTAAESRKAALVRGPALEEAA